MKLIDLTLLKFLLVGIVNTLFGCGIMFLLYNLAHCSYWLSSAANYIVGGIVSFFLNKYFTFRSEEKSFSQFLLFAANVALCYLIAYIGAKKLIQILLTGASEQLSGNVALFCGMCIYTALNFLGQKCIVFKKSGRENETNSNATNTDSEAKK